MIDSPIYALKRELLDRALASSALVEALPLAREAFDWLVDGAEMLAVPHQVPTKAQKPHRAKLETAKDRPLALPAPALPADEFFPAAQPAAPKEKMTGDRIQWIVHTNPGITSAKICELYGADPKRLSVMLAHLKLKGVLRTERSDPANGKPRNLYFCNEIEEAPVAKKKDVVSAPPVASPSAPRPPAAQPAPSPDRGQDTQAMIAAHIAEKGVTKCPTVALEPTQAAIAKADSEKVRAHQIAMGETGDWKQQSARARAKASA